MLALLFSLCLKIIPPMEYQSSAKKTTKDSYYKETCDKQFNEDFHDLKGNEYNLYFYCNRKSYPLIISQCRFYDILMNSNIYSYLILAYYNDLTIEDSNFSDIKVYRRLISCEKENYKVILKSNQFTNIEFSSGNYDEAYVIWSDFKTQEIINNRISLDPSQGSRVGVGFYLKYHSGCIYQHNTVINGQFTKKAGGLHFDEKGSSSNLVLSDSLFRNCLNNNPAILHIPQLDFNLTIKNVTFEKTENNYVYSGQQGYLISIFPKKSNWYHLIFDKCKFSNLKSNSRGGGGIGVWFSYDKNSHNILEFKETTFEHITFTHDIYGGGAISIDSDESNSKTKLIVSKCKFTDISSLNGKGGAIYYSPYNDDDFCTIKVIETNFTKIHSPDDGNAIYIGPSKSILNAISFCKFVDCNNDKENKYTVYFDVRYVDFTFNTVSFSDPDKNQGCIFSNILVNHVYKGNFFTNAKTNGAFSAGIHEANPTNDARLTIENNTFDHLSGSSYGRCIRTNIYNLLGLNMRNNTIQNCPQGGSFIQIYLVFINMESFTIESFKFIGNSVETSLNANYESTPQVEIFQFAGENDFYDPIILTFSNCYFENNYSPSKGGAINYGKSRFIAYTKVHFYMCEFIENYAKEGGGALAIQTYQGCLIEQCKFIKNKVDSGSSTIYIETEFKCKNGNNGYLDIPSNRNPVVEIIDSIFTDNKEGSTSCILIDSSQNAPVSIEKSKFTNCGTNGNVIDVKSNINSISVIDCDIEFTDANGCGGISINSNGIATFSEICFIQTSKNSALSITSSDSTNPISIKKCLFDSCLGSGCSCLSLSTKTDSLSFENNTIQNIVVKGCNNYIGSINCNDKVASLTFKEINFFSNIASSLYGGGSGLIFSGISELSFDNCYFTNNSALQDKSIKRSSQYDELPYYNGDGGAFQIGHLCSSNNIKVKFYRCHFNQNKAQRHGGAISLQTLSNVEIDDCNFVENIANYNFQDAESNLLFDDHFYKKVDGRGGAIYINPSYFHECQCENSYMPEIKIMNCRINSNTAYDGYAMYIEGDETDTLFFFQKNTFNDNLNASNKNNENPKVLFGAVITTEIHSITNSSLKENQNYFAYINNFVVNQLSYVDHYGHTPSDEFTPSDFFPSNNFTFSKEFTQSYSFSNSQVFSNSGKFTKSKAFSQSNNFVKTEEFTKSKEFSRSDNFVKTDGFTKSKEFSQSDEFEKTKVFTSSSMFTYSSYFSKSNDFIKTKEFSSSDDFSSSALFVNKITEIIITEEKITTETPTTEITETPTVEITETPTTEITETPTIELTGTPTIELTETPTIEITETPTIELTETPTIELTETPTIELTGTPTIELTGTPTIELTETPTIELTGTPTIELTGTPTIELTETPTIEITETPTTEITETPTIEITETPTTEITETPTIEITEERKTTKTQTIKKTDELLITSAQSQTLTNNVNNPIKTSSLISNEEDTPTISTKNENDDTGVSSSQKTNKKINLPLIIGVVVGIVVLIALVILVIIFVLRRKRSHRNYEVENNATEMSIEETSMDNSVDFTNPLFNGNKNQNDPFDESFDDADLI